MVAIQIHRPGVHAVIEAFQDEGTGGEGASEIPREATRNHWARCDSDKKEVGATVVPNAVTVHVGTRTHLSGLPTYQALAQWEHKFPGKTAVLHARPLLSSGRRSWYRPVALREGIGYCVSPILRRMSWKRGSDFQGKLSSCIFHGRNMWWYSYAASSARNVSSLFPSTV